MRLAVRKGKSQLSRGAKPPLLQIRDEVFADLVYCEEGSPATGWFKWRVYKNKAVPGSWAGTVTRQGYRRIWINGVAFLEHRLVYWLHFREVPRILDHIDHNKLNNSIQNLRGLSNRENVLRGGLKSNNVSGYKGVSLNRETGKWRAMVIRKDGRKESHMCKNAEDAATIYNILAVVHYGPEAALNKTIQTCKNFTRDLSQ